MIRSTLSPQPASELQPAGGDRPPTDEMLYLTGRPTLKQFTRFVRNNAIDPPEKGELADEWSAALKVVEQLTTEEAGCADGPQVTPVPVDATYEPLLTELLKDPLVRHGFNTVPTEIAFVELDRLVVHQKHIDLTHVRKLQEELGPEPDAARVFRACLPYDHPRAPVAWARTRHDRFVFVSPSNDLRFLEAAPLSAAQLAEYAPAGNVVGVVGLSIGFGSNFMNAIAAENRVILANGSHRAHALRALGFTHVPCIVQHASSRPELDLVAASRVEDDPDLYLKHPRPPMLKDYFDPRLRKVMAVQRRNRQVTVRFEIEETYVPAV